MNAKILSLYVVCSMLFTLLLTPLTAAAAPCELTKDRFGKYSGNCYLPSRFGDELRFETLEWSPDSFRIFRLKMPDLYSDDGDYNVFGTAVEVEVRTGNSGDYRSGDFDVTAEVHIKYPNGTIYGTQIITGRVTGIDPGQRTRTVLGYVTVPDRVSDWDLHVTFFVDSDNMASGGEIWEADETNNVFDDGICRVYGQDPDLTVGACD